ncbi:MAG: hypothetical protein WBD36_15695 [Bacteroidota bacterium]
MKHLTTTEIFGVVDGTILNGEKTTVLRHLEECGRCRQEVAFQKTLALAARNQSLTKPSKGFTARVMSTVLPPVHRSLTSRLLDNLGNLFAMMLVVGVVGYIVSGPALSSGSTAQSETYQLFKGFSDGYATVNQFLSQQSFLAKQKVVETTSGAKVLLFTIATLLFLAAIDRFVLRQFLKMKL